MAFRVFPLIDAQWETALTSDNAGLTPEKILARFIEVIPDAILVYDAEGRVAYINETAEQMLGRGRNEVIGLRYDDASWNFKTVAGNPFPESEHPFSRVSTKKGPVYDVERSLERPDGTAIIVSSDAAPLGIKDGKVIGVVEVLRDVTEKTTALQAREEARLFAQSIVDTVRGPLVILDGDLRVVSANHAFYQAFKLRPEDAEGRLFYEIGMREWDIPEVRSLLEKILPERTHFDDFEVTTDFPAVGRRTMLLNARELRREAGKRRLILLAMEDITERKAAEELRRAYEVERRIAQTLQERLLRPLPKVPGFDVGVAYASSFEAARVGGDYYDVFKLENGMVVAMVGDISGKGIEVAAITETVRSSMRAIAYLDPSPSFILNQTNRAMLQQVKPGEFATACIVSIDAKTHRAKCASAGHPPPILCDDPCRLLDIPSNLPLGSFSERYREIEFELRAGQLIILYTDGLIEARWNAELFGEERSIEALMSLRDRKAKAIAEELLNRARGFAKGKLKDDIAIVAIRLLES